MIRLSATVLAGWLLAAMAVADLSTSLVPVPNGLGPNTATFDLMVEVDWIDDWTSTSMSATATGAKFLFNATAPGATPNPALFPLFPSLEWETMFTSPEAWPNTAGQGAPPGIAQKELQESQILATWFATPPNGGPGTWVVARVTFVDLQPGWSALIEGAHTSVTGQGKLYPYQFTVPEPSAGMMLLAVCLASGRFCRWRSVLRR